MKKGDISNQLSSLNIGFRINDFLVKERQIKLAPKLKSFFTGSIDRSAVDPSVLRCLNNISYRTSMSVDLILIGYDELKYEDSISDIPYNFLHKVENIYDVESLLHDGTLSYFISLHTDQLMLGNKFCLTLDEFNNLLSKGLKRV